MTQGIIVVNSCGSEAEARQVARALVEAKVAACVNIVPRAQSIYRWQGRIEEAEEWLLLIKTRRDLFDEVATVLRQAHSYELPEIVALPIMEGLPAYLDWIASETK